MRFIGPRAVLIETNGIVDGVSAMMLSDGSEPDLSACLEISGVRLGHEDTCPDDDAYAEHLDAMAEADASTRAFGRL